MKLNLTKEQWMAAADREGDAEVGAGLPPNSMRPSRAGTSSRCCPMAFMNCHGKSGYLGERLYARTAHCAAPHQTRGD